MLIQSHNWLVSGISELWTQTVRLEPANFTTTPNCLFRRHNRLPSFTVGGLLRPFPAKLALSCTAWAQYWFLWGFRKIYEQKNPCFDFSKGSSTSSLSFLVGFFLGISDPMGSRSGHRSQVLLAWFWEAEAVPLQSLEPPVSETHSCCRLEDGYRDGPLAAPGPIGDSAPAGFGPLPLQDIPQKFMGLRNHSLVLRAALMEACGLALVLCSSRNCCGSALSS